MSCREREENIALYAGGDLDASRRAELEHHLAECAMCREFAREMAECLGAMQDAHSEEFAPAHFTAVRSRVLAELRSRPQTHAWRWIAAACAALLLLVLGVARFIHPDPPPPQVALARPPAPPSSVTVSPLAVKPAKRAPRSHPERRSEPVLVQIQTSNPDVVIYWVAN
jgi:anti-sigma factor RsiW